MNASPVSDILSCYFDIKRNKLHWKGSLDDLKAFVLTEVDEETAASTTWCSPGGGTWNFESILLAVTWLTTSQNIYFDGEKGSDLIERVHEFLKRRESISEATSVEMPESQPQVQDENETYDSSEYFPNTAAK